MSGAISGHSLVKTVKKNNKSSYKTVNGWNSVKSMPSHAHSPLAISALGIWRCNRNE